jgi:hypothetical protein
MNTHAALPVSRSGASGLVRYIAGETCIGMAVNIAIGGVATWFLADPAGLAHAHLADAARQLVMPTLGPATGLVPGITGVTRNRVAKGTAPRLPAIVRLPHNIIARTMIIGLAALILVAGPGMIILYYYLHAAPVSFARLMIFMVGYGAVFGLVVSPVTVAAALADAPVKVQEKRRC